MPETVLKISELRTSRVGKSGTTDLLTDVNVDVHRGEIVGIVGESGVGKSLLMASVLNLLNPPVQVTGGEVMFGSRDLAKLSEAQRTAVAMHYERGLQCKEIAARTGAGIEAVKKHLQRARAALQQCIMQRTATGQDGA